ncbi:MAG: DUF6754 domain-containing protein [Candidatus Bathyarchaeota archaeon]
MAVTTQELIFASVFIVGMTGVFFYFRQRATRGAVPKIRMLEGLKGIEEAVKKCAETGETVAVYSSGNLTGAGIDQSVAGLGILSYAVRLIARNNCRMVFPYTGDDILAIPVYNEVIRAAYAAEGKINSFDPKAMRMISRTYADAMAPWANTIVSENCGATMLFGDIRYFNPVCVDLKGISIQATGQMNTVHVCALLCDYSLIGDEMFAAGAMISEDRVVLSSLAVQDIGKFIIAGVSVIGAVLWAWGIKVV